jgi:hypothetical protein
MVCDIPERLGIGEPLLIQLAAERIDLGIEVPVYPHPGVVRAESEAPDA